MHASSLRFCMVSSAPYDAKLMTKLCHLEILCMYTSIITPKTGGRFFNPIFLCSLITCGSILSILLYGFDYFRNFFFEHPASSFLIIAMRYFLCSHLNVNVILKVYFFVLFVCGYVFGTIVFFAALPAAPLGNCFFSFMNMNRKCSFFYFIFFIFFLSFFFLQEFETSK
jgi:hypothetical protein